MEVINNVKFENNGQGFLNSLKNWTHKVQNGQLMTRNTTNEKNRKISHRNVFYISDFKIHWKY